MENRVPPCFFENDALQIAPQMLGMKLVRRFSSSETAVLTVSDVEVYRGEEDLACHASKGKTLRTDIMYQKGGSVYVYLIYGIYWLLNITTGKEGQPQAILIRGTEQIDGPGRIGRHLMLNKSFYGENITTSQRLWMEYGEKTNAKILEIPRVGISYAGEFWANIPWRFKLEKH